MKNILLITLALISVSLFAHYTVQAEEQKVMQQTYGVPEAKMGDKVLCPVMKTPITVSDKTPAVKIKDKNYYVCCNDCVGKLKSEPDKYLTPKDATSPK